MASPWLMKVASANAASMGFRNELVSVLTYSKRFVVYILYSSHYQRNIGSPSCSNSHCDRFESAGCPHPASLFSAIMRIAARPGPWILSDEIWKPTLYSQDCHRWPHGVAVTHAVFDEYEKIAVELQPRFLS